MRTLGIVALTALLLGSCQRATVTSEAAPPHYATIEAGKDLAAYSLRDPASADYREVFVQLEPVRDFDWVQGHVVCGQINGKNAYGAYAGFRRFVAVPLTRRVEHEPDDAGPGKQLAFEMLWRTACLGAPIEG